MRFLWPWNFPVKNTGVGCPPPGDLPDRGTKPVSLVSSELSGRFFTNCATWEVLLEEGGGYLIQTMLPQKSYLFIYLLG